MKILRRALPILLLTSLSGVGLHAQAHDTYGSTAVTSMAASQSKQYNPWRPLPRQWGNKPRNKPHATPEQQFGYTPAYAVPLHPIHARQYEYRNYVYQVSPYYANGGIPWWADQSAVPYGPWSQGSGFLNGLR